MNCKILKCPVCGKDLTSDRKSVICASRHCFDISAKGYINLLKINSKNSVNPGDGREMLEARRRTFSRGMYAELADALCEAARGYVGENSVVVDAGCGEGYYIKYLKDYFNSRGIEAEYCALDISKYAVLMAAEKNQSQITYLVASVFDMPLKDAVCDLVVRNFAPDASGEFFRVLKGGGVLISVTPGREHLIELKNALYQNVYFNEPAKPEDGFEKISGKNLTYRRELSAEALYDLFAMTPYYYKTSPEALANISETLNLTFDFEINVYRKPF